MKNCITKMKRKLLSVNHQKFSGTGVSCSVKPNGNEVLFNNLHGDGSFDSMEFGAGVSPEMKKYF